MPKQGKLTKDQLDQIHYVSISDFMRRIDTIKDFDSKVAFATRYLLTYNLNEVHDYTFTEALHFARMKIGEASISRRNQMAFLDDHIVNPDLENKADDKDNEIFIGRPGDYILNEASQAIAEIESKPTRTAQEEFFRQNCEFLLQELDPMVLNDKLDDLVELAPSIDVEARLEGAYGSKAALERAYNATKPGVFSKMFHTYSQAYRNLDTVYQAFHDQDHALYGNLGALDKAAKEYLQHRFPNWNPRSGSLPSEEDIAALSGTEKARTEFSISLIKAVAAERKVQASLDKLVTSCEEKASDYLAAPAAQEEANLDQVQFQEQLSQELEPEVEEVAYDQEQAERDYHAVFADDPEIKA